MESISKTILLEENRLQTTLDAMRSTLSGEEADRKKLAAELADLKAQKLAAPGWQEKREIDQLMDSCRERAGMRHYQDPAALSQPYFGVLEIEDDDLGSLTHCLGARSFFSSRGKALVIDWREAPISRLYYEYDSGEFYEETIQKRERTGTIRAKRQVDTSGGALRKILVGDVLHVKGGDGEWRRADEPAGAVSRKEERADHRLPEITALISRDQFRAITHPESSTVILQGGAGSGKTTVGLHRIAYLTYQDPERFRPDRILVVMFNRSLQHYIAGVLPSLGIEPGVQVETYHSWAGKLFRRAGAPVTYTSRTPPDVAVFLKKHPIMLTLVDRYLQKLLENSRSWLLQQCRRAGDPQLETIEEVLHSVTDVQLFTRLLEEHPIFRADSQPEYRRRSVTRLQSRLKDHGMDLQAALGDDGLLKQVLTDAAVEIDSASPAELEQWQARLRQEGKIDFADTGLFLLLLQRKGALSNLPRYAHIMVDEAQDLSEVELATLLHAADDAQSITICGDMAQQIKSDVSFESSRGFAGFIRKIRHGCSGGAVRADTLVVGYRATRPIMELAWRVLGEKKGSMAVPRDGAPVQIVRTKSPEETILKAGDILVSYLTERPGALVGVVCRYKAEADRVYEDLKTLQGVRRHQRDDFSFEPGIVVTNAHQVKGLEFSAILVVNPGESQYRDDPTSRMLLHVVLTRAADHLWIIGHQTMAYGLERLQ